MVKCNKGNEANGVGTKGLAIERSRGPEKRPLPARWSKLQPRNDLI